MLKLSGKSSLDLRLFGLLLLCAAWLVPGLIGHAPWKGGDGEHFVRLWQMLQHGDALPPDLAVPPLYYKVAAGTAWLAAPVLDLANGARLASGLFVALAVFFVARTARVLYGGEASWAAALGLLGCFGLLVHGHELNADTAELAAAAIILYAIARLPHAVHWGWALAFGVALMLLAGGAAKALLFLALGAFLPILLPDYRTRIAGRALALGIVGAVVFAAAWFVFLETRGMPWRRVFDLERWLGGGEKKPLYFPSILGWYAWPVWPLAAWAVYRERRRWRTVGIVLPSSALLALLGLYAFAADPAPDQGLLLLLPLTLLGAIGLFTLRRGAANALLWFAVMLFGFIGLVLWVYWSAHDLGMPARLAARLSKLGLTHVGELRPWTLVLGVGVTATWIAFLGKVSRSPLRPILVWTAGITFIWVLLMALFQAPLDRRLSYEGVAEALAARVPASECIQTHQVRQQQRVLLAYHSGLRFIPTDVGCNWLLVETRRREPLPHIAPEWVKRWEGARPGDRSDRFHLYARD